MAKQIFKPTSDVSASGSWTPNGGGTHFSKVDSGENAIGGDYTSSPNGDGSLTLGLNDPNDDFDQKGALCRCTVDYKSLIFFGEFHELTIQVFSSSGTANTNPATFTPSPDNNIQQHVFNLPVLSATAADWTGAKLKVTVGGDGEGFPLELHNIYLMCPYLKTTEAVLRPDGNVNTGWEPYEHFAIDDPVFGFDFGASQGITSAEAASDGQVVGSGDIDATNATQTYTLTSVSKAFTSITSVTVCALSRENTTNGSHTVTLNIGGVDTSALNIDTGENNQLEWNSVSFSVSNVPEDFDDATLSILSGGSTFNYDVVYAIVEGTTGAPPETCDPKDSQNSVDYSFATGADRHSIKSYGINGTSNTLDVSRTPDPGDYQYVIMNVQHDLDPISEATVGTLSCRASGAGAGAVSINCYGILPIDPIGANDNGTTGASTELLAGEDRYYPRASGLSSDPTLDPFNDLTKFPRTTAVAVWTDSDASTFDDYMTFDVAPIIAELKLAHSTYPGDAFRFMLVHETAGGNTQTMTLSDTIAPTLTTPHLVCPSHANKGYSKNTEYVVSLGNAADSEFYGAGSATDEVVSSGGSCTGSVAFRFPSVAVDSPGAGGLDGAAPNWSVVSAATLEFTANTAQDGDKWTAFVADQDDVASLATSGGVGTEVSQWTDTVDTEPATGDYSAIARVHGSADTIKIEQGLREAVAAVFMRPGWASGNALGIGVTFEDDNAGLNAVGISNPVLRFTLTEYSKEPFETGTSIHYYVANMLGSN